MTLQLRHYVFLAMLAFVLSLPGRISLPPLDRDEPRYMEATKQMLSSRNFLDIRFQNTPRYLQPAGIYWLEASTVGLSEYIFGAQTRHQAWPYRVPSLIATSLIIPLTAWLGTALFGAETGLLAACFLFFSTLFGAESRMATIDTVLLLDILIIEALLLRHFQDLNTHKTTPRFITISFWLALGVGLMLKGPVVLIPGLGTPAALSLTERNLSIWRRLSAQWGWLIMIAVGLPWFIGINIISHGLFLSRAVGHNLLGKVSHAQESHGFMPGYYILTFLLTFWPGALFTAHALPALWQHRRLKAVRFLLCWILPHWIFFELLATKLPHYVFPTFPAIAILTAASLTVWSVKIHSKIGKILLGTYSILWATIGFLFCCFGVVLLFYMEHFISFQALLVLFSSVSLLTLSLWLFYHQRTREAAHYSLGAAAMTHFSIFLIIIPAFSHIQLSPKAAAAFNQWRPCPQSVLISASYYEPSLVFLAGEHTRLLAPTLAAQSLYEHASCDLALVDEKDEALFTNFFKNKKIHTHTLTHISGINYSNGHHMNLKLISASYTK